MKAQTLTKLIMILALVSFSQACKEDAKKKTGTANITDPEYDPYAPVSAGNGVPYISVTSAAGSMVSVPLNTPATVSFSITNASNVQSILTASPVGSQFSGNTTLNPSLYWATPTQGTHTVTIFARNMTLCETTSPGNCQLSGLPIVNPAYDSQQSFTISVGATTGSANVDPTTGLPIDPTTGLPYPNNNNNGTGINSDLLSQIASLLGIDINNISLLSQLAGLFGNN